jgi:HPr kinase/phosphorylase
MRTRISARELYDQLQERLGLRWITTGQRGGERTLERSEQLTRRPSLAGYLNVIHPNKVQIVGSAELAWLDTLDARQRWETLEKIMGFTPMALVISQNQVCPPDLRAICEESNTALWVSAKRGFELLNLLQYHMALALAPRVSLHGVFMEIFSIGVLITGDSGAGKSELALELISRGHRLVADDAPEFTQIAPDVLDGTCPDMLQDMLEVRGLGVMNIRQMFGDTAVKRNKYLRLIVQLIKASDHNSEAMSRLTGEAPAPCRVLDLDVPVFQLPVAAGRNLAVLTEAAVRLHMLRVKGLDPAAAFLARHASLLSLSQES